MEFNCSGNNQQNRRQMLRYAQSLKTATPLRSLKRSTHHCSSFFFLKLWFCSDSSSKTSNPSLHNYYLRKRRKWLPSPHKANWHLSFTDELALEALKKSVKASKSHLLSSLTDSFAAYECEPTPSAYHYVIKTLIRSPSNWDQIPQVLDHIEKVANFETPEYILADVIKFYGGSDMVEQAIKLFFRLPAFRCAPSVHSLNALLSVLCQKGRALEIVPEILMKSQSMKIRLEESSFSILITALCEIGKPGSAIELLNHMASDGLTVDGESCSLILSKMCEQLGSNEDEVLSFLERMRELGISPKMGDFCNLVRFLVEKDKGMLALDIMNQMKRDKMKPNVACYNLVLHGLIREGEFGIVDDLFDEMLVWGLVPNVWTYNVYISGLCKQNKMEQAMKMLASMEQLGCKPDQTTYNTILKALFASGKVGCAREIIAKKEADGIQLGLRTYEITIAGLVSNGEIDEACTLLHGTISKYSIPWSVAFDDIIYALCQRNLLAKAQELLSIVAREGAAPGARTWKMIVEAAQTQGLQDINPVELDYLLRD